MPSTRQPGCAAEPGADARADRSCTAGSRTTPPLPTSPRPTSNCGLISATSAGARRGQRQRRRQHRFEADEAGVADHEVDRLRDLGARQVARVGLLQHRRRADRCAASRRAGPARRRRIDLGGAVRQQHVGEAAGRGADVEADERRARSRPNAVERMRELQAAARHPGMVLAAQLQRRVGGQHVARPCRPGVRR